MDFEDKQKIFDGVIINDMKHIKEVSCYNNNYYIYKSYILFGKSNDDTETEWYLIDYDKRYDLIGYSYVSDSPEKIIVTKEMHT